MSRVSLIAAVLSVALCACSGESPPPVKVDGPAIRSLSLTQLEKIESTCNRFGDPNDPRVPYSLAYCVRVEGAWNIRDYARPSTAPVKPTLDTVH